MINFMKILVSQLVLLRFINRKNIVLIFILFVLNCNALSTNHYVIDSLFTIEVSKKLEKRNKTDKYTKSLDIKGSYQYDTNKIIFQQKGLSQGVTSAMSQYCRIIITTTEEEKNVFWASNEDTFTSEDLDFFKSLADDEIGPGMEYICNPNATVCTNDKGHKYVRVDYVRSGLFGKGDVSVSICLFFNYDSFAKVILSYRSSERKIWESVLNETINSFNWTNPYIIEEINTLNTSPISPTENGQVANNIIVFLVFIIVLFILIFLIKKYRKHTNIKQKEDIKFNRIIAVKNYNTTEFKRENDSQQVIIQINEIEKIANEAKAKGNNLKAQILLDYANRLREKQIDKH